MHFRSSLSNKTLGRHLWAWPDSRPARISKGYPALTATHVLAAMFLQLTARLFTVTRAVAGSYRRPTLRPLRVATV